MVALRNAGLELRQRRHRKTTLAQILSPAPGPLSHRGGEEHLAVGVGEHGGADIAPLSHQATAGTHGLLLAGEGRAHTAMGRHRTHLGRDLGAADRVGHVMAIDLHPLLLCIARGELQIKTLQQRRHRTGIGGVHALALHPPGEGPIHGAGVEINQAKTPGKGPGDRALTGAGRTINRNDRRARHQENVIDQTT